MNTHVLHKKLTTISISHENKLKLRALGYTGDSYDGVLTEILNSAISANIGNRRPTSVLEVGTTKHLSAGAPSVLPTHTRREHS